MNNNVCPYCGQVFTYDDTLDPRERCRCPQALDWQRRQELKDKLVEAVDNLFGENADVSEEFQPVSEAVYLLIRDMAVEVALGNVEGAGFTLQDGSKVKISPKGVERKKQLGVAYKL